jgi:galactose mutarotase-like enzyme
MFSIQDARLGELHAVELHDLSTQARVVLVPSRGALVTSFRALGREWLYLDEATLFDPAANVRGGIPVLFPSPGKLENDQYAAPGTRMKQHGFARNLAFVELERGTSGGAFIELELRDNETTREAFPFSFQLRLRFRLSGTTLEIRAEVLNSGSERLPFALGYHPYFQVPAQDKPHTKIPTQATRAWDNVAKREVGLEVIRFGDSELDLHLLDHNSNGASLETPHGSVQLGGHFTRWVVWSLPNRDFVCLEPWTAPANALNSGEGLLALEPGESRCLAVQIALSAG